MIVQSIGWTGLLVLELESRQASFFECGPFGAVVFFSVATGEGRVVGDGAFDGLLGEYRR